jgi:PAS domain S-box-containing protein
VPHLRYAVGLAAALNLLLAGISAAALVLERRHGEDLAAVTTRNLSQALDTSVSELVARADQALLTVKDLYEHALAAGEVDEARLEQLVAQQHAHLRNVDSLRIATADGLIRYGTGVRASPRQEVTDRAYFRRHRDEGKPGLLVSEPVVGKISRRWVVILSRRLDRPDGGFAGVVYAGVLVDALTGLFAAIDLGPDGVVALRDDQLRSVARYPVSGPAGADVAARPVSPELMRLVAEGKTSASYFTNASPDGIPRVFTFRKLAGAPLLLAVGISRDAYLAPWRRDVAYVAVLLALSLAGTAVALGALRRAALREQEATRALRLQEERYRIVADHTADWEYWLGPGGDFIYCSPSCVKVTGRYAEEFYAEPDLLLRVLHPDDRGTFQEHRREVERRHGGGSILLRVRHTDGQLRWIDHVCTAIVDGSGTYLGARGSNRDVTETKAQQDLLLARKHELEATLARTKRLEGIISVCMYCKRINNDNRSWERMEEYLSDHSDAQFSHGVCPECYAKHADD